MNRSTITGAHVMMISSKYSKVRQPIFHGELRSPKTRIWGKLHYNAGLLILAGMSTMLVLFGREGSETGVGLVDDFRRVMISTSSLEEEQPQWNYSSYSFTPNVSDWDEQRAAWSSTKHPNATSARAGGKPYIMMVTGSSPKECDPTILSHLFLRASKNKLDYSRMHDIELYYNLGQPDEDFSDTWVKLPVIRMLMLQHPQVEWIWWLEADAVITDLTFEPPFSDLNRDNLVLYGGEREVYGRSLSWTGVSTSNFMIRNCQWSLDLLDEWASMGTTSVRAESGYFQSQLLADRPRDFPADDQSGIVAVLAQDKRKPIGQQRWAPMVKLVKETDYHLAANWTAIGPKLEEAGLPGYERVPFVTHFAGCLPSCNAKPHMSTQFLNACVEQLGRAFDFADNQMYKEFGFEPRTLGDHLTPLHKKPPTEPIEKEFTADGEEIFRIAPRYSDWDERRASWMQQHPLTRKDEVVLVSGSAPKPCESKLGSHTLLWGLKNLIDYGRKNEMVVFYNNAAIDEDLKGWWSKLPLLKMMMLNYPGAEWVWWLDSDAVITDMDYTFDFSRYNANGHNIVLYGSEHLVFHEHSYVGINTGNLLIRNCQWSLDLFDRWASYGATREIRMKYDKLLNDTLPDRGIWGEADDQSVLAYLLISEREKWGTSTFLETGISMSGYWRHLATQFRDEHPAEERPFVTHFAGCKPCRDPTEELLVWCMNAIAMTYNFADNQVLAQYGLRHVNLNSSELLQRSSLVIEEPQTLAEAGGKDESEEQQMGDEFEELNPSNEEKTGHDENEEPEL